MFGAILGALLKNFHISCCCQYVKKGENVMPMKGPVSILSMAPLGHHTCALQLS